jgi:hypothetical protein
MSILTFVCSHENLLLTCDNFRAPKPSPIAGNPRDLLLGLVLRQHQRTHSLHCTLAVSYISHPSANYVVGQRKLPVFVCLFSEKGNVMNLQSKLYSRMNLRQRTGLENQLQRAVYAVDPANVGVALASLLCPVTCFASDDHAQQLLSTLTFAPLMSLFRGP